MIMRGFSRSSHFSLAIVAVLVLLLIVLALPLQMARIAARLKNG